MNAIEKIDKFVDEYYETHKTSGYLRITLKDEIIFEKHLGYADFENKIPFTKKSKFTLYSLSKPFCAIGLMKLKDKNLIDIDEHPGKYLPEAKDFDKTMTIRHLLYHISGVPDFDQDTDFREKYKGEESCDLRKQVELLSKQELLFKPGTDSKYTNANFIICALIIENISKMKYADYMKTEVFEPLNMHDTCIDNKNLILEHRVKGYAQEEEKIFPVERVKEWVMGGADVISTVDDVYCLNKAIKHNLLLKPETWEEILTSSPVSFMGLGCSVSQWHGMKRITHNGGWDGFRTLHVQLPEDDFDIIFLSNAGWGNARNDFIDFIYSAYYDDDNKEDLNVKMDAGYIK